MIARVLMDLKMGCWACTSRVKKDFVIMPCYEVNGKHVFFLIFTSL